MKLGISRIIGGGAKYAALLTIFTITSIAARAELDESKISVENGKTVFMAKCATCHSSEEGVIVTGPSLFEVEARWDDAGIDRELLYLWVKNPTEAKNQGNAYINKLWDEWVPKAGAMTGQAVSNEDVESILAYLADPSSKGGGPDIGGGCAPQELPPAEGGVGMWMWITLGLLVVVIFSAAGVRRQLSLANRKKNGEDDDEMPTYAAELKTMMWNNKKTVSVIILILVAFGLKDTWYTLKDIGVYGGNDFNTGMNYRPEQPIDFSHNIHAGCNEIECVYCHSSAEKGKHAGIPSTNVCMNCHKFIKEGKREGSADEIGKIYDAIGWNPETMAYGEEGDPIKWVKVHNLPDHVYFNHSQHVVVAGLDCQECHGPVEKMDVVEQVAPLTMGWCIQCHNETEVKHADNGYYKEMHKRFSKDDLRKFLEDEKITAREMGGWECSKCHY